MRTHGHREKSITHWVSCWGLVEGQCGVGRLGGITQGEMPDIGDRKLEAANHLHMYVPMQQSCMICICTPECKVQFKIEKKKKGTTDTLRRWGGRRERGRKSNYWVLGLVPG